MEWGIDTYKDLIQIATWIIGSLFLVMAVISYWLSRKNLNFNVIFNCNKRFQEIRTGINKSNADSAKRYVDLCNEEIFYYEHSFVPDEIIKEWIDGMIFYIPHYTSKDNFYTEAKLHNYIIKEDEFNEYPRLEKAFKVKRLRNIKNEKEREELVSEIMNNIS